jgi:hypothetical protein
MIIEGCSPLHVLRVGGTVVVQVDEVFRQQMNGGVLSDGHNRTCRSDGGQVLVLVAPAQVHGNRTGARAVG